MFAIIADDLTGACDTAAKLSERGIFVQVLLEMPDPVQSIEYRQVIAVNTNSRSLPADEAYQKVKDAVHKLKQQGFTTYYKKIDSMFRGNVAVEIQAMMEALQCSLAIITSAVPKNNRKIIDGRLIVKYLPDNGTEVLKSVFSDRIEQCANINLRTVRKGVLKIKEEILREIELGKKIFLMDSDSEDDIGAIAAVCETLPHNVLYVGASSFIAPLSMNWCVETIKAINEDKLQGILQQNKSLLYVIGTNNPVSLDQVRYMIDQERIPNIKVDVIQCTSGNWDVEAKRCLDSADILLHSMPKSFLVVVDSIDNGIVIEGNRNNGEKSIPEITGCISQVVKTILQKYEFGAMVLVGGDTAQAVLSAMGVKTMQIICEYAPGIPMAIIQLGNNKEMVVVTRSGGFGEPDSFVGFQNYLNELCEKTEVT